MRVVILDRDGVINWDSEDYIRTPEQWVPIPGSLEAIARLCRADYRVIVATNQSGVGRGLFDIHTLNKIHTRMLEQVRYKGGEIDAIFFCPHHPDVGCECRKPRPGMLKEAALRLKMSLTGVPVVGDSLRDIEAAVSVDALPVLLNTGYRQVGEAALAEVCGATGTRRVLKFDDLAGFADALLGGNVDQRIQSLTQSEPPG
ncbi:MAG: D-glycero-beta-D-manno-heptose 1,7-bisphosphate 7-phosphatase [Gammaproteobacteria bacterium]|nr:D-glycero-beta-D-manno-heptose 1,7-bisphosphate 7-phosphatase [Gammaproteobacteria bacterium]